MKKKEESDEERLRLHRVHIEREANGRTWKVTRERKGKGDGETMTGCKNLQEVFYFIFEIYDDHGEWLPPEPKK